MSTIHVASLRDPRYVAERARACAGILGQHIRSVRLLDGRPLDELAPQAGLTVADWEALEAGQLPVPWEQILLLAMVLRLGRSWLSYLGKLWAQAWPK